MQEPEQRLRSLEIPFDYPDNVLRLYVDVMDPRVLNALEDSLKTSDPDDEEDLRLDKKTTQSEGFRAFANLFHFTGFINTYTLSALREQGTSKIAGKCSEELGSNLCTQIILAKRSS